MAIPEVFETVPCMPADVGAGVGAGAGAGAGAGLGVGVVGVESDPQSVDKSDTVTNAATASIWRIPRGASFPPR
jgi:hypothetical protein